MAAKTSQANQLMEKFAAQPTQNKIAIFVGIGALLGFLYWYLYYGDLNDQLTMQKQESTRLAKEDEQLRDRKKKYRELIEKKEAVEKALQTNAVSLPASSELPSFFVSLQSQAITANVQLIKWTRLDEQPIETYVKVPVGMEVRGDFQQIMNYFKLLHETRRIITVEDLIIGDGKREGTRYLVNAKFTASTFRQADLPPQPAPPGGGAAPAAPAGGAAPAPPKGGGR
jgi:Tfp pilus assembly protein PilO